MSMRRLIAIVFGAVLLLALLPGFASAQGSIYVVQPGDTLRSIAAARGVTMQAIIQANALDDPDNIRVGQQLLIPAAGQVQAAPKASTAPKATAAPAATPRTGRYVVQPGDTINGIAVRFGSTAAAIIRANNIANPDLLRAGATLVIPPAGSSGETEAAAAAEEPPPAITLPGKASSGSAGQDTNSYGGGAPTRLDPTRFIVSISRQHCWFYEMGELVGNWPCSTGRKNYETPTGFYTVQSKIPVAYGSTWGFYLPNWLGIYEINGLENGIHGLPYNKWGFKDWANRIGTPISFGCIVLQDEAAERVYEAAELGMQVIIVK